MSSERSMMYERDGFCVVKGVFSSQEMSDWKQRIVARMEDAGSDEDPSGVAVWTADSLDAFFTEALTGDPVAALLHDIMGPDVEFLSVKPVFKNSKVVFGSPWHHDWAYWGGSNKVSVWIALDKATQGNGCLKMIPGSHKTRVDMKTSTDGAGFGNRIEEEDIAGLPVVPVEAEQGDIVIFHDLTLHASFPNTNAQDRWSFIATYRDSSVPDDSAVWTTSLKLNSN